MKRVFSIILLSGVYTYGICQDTHKQPKTSDLGVIANNPADSLVKEDSVVVSPLMLDSIMKGMDTMAIYNAIISKLDSAMRDSVYKSYMNAYADSLKSNNGDSAMSSPDSMLIAAFDKALYAMDSAYKGVSSSALDSLSKTSDDSVFNSDKKLVMIKFNGLDKLMGLSYEKFEYDRRGDMVCSTNYNDSNEIRPGFAGIAITVCKYDKKHNCTEERFSDEHKKAMNDKVFGVSVIRNKYNKLNQLVESDYFDTGDKPLPSYAKTTYEYDAQGNISTTTNYNAKGEVVR